jgi:hypothetical protein
MGGHVVIPVGDVQGISLPLLLQSKLTANAKKNYSNTTANVQQKDDWIKPRTCSQEPKKWLEAEGRHWHASWLLTAHTRTM